MKRKLPVFSIMNIIRKTKTENPIVHVYYFSGIFIFIQSVRQSFADFTINNSQGRQLFADFTINNSQGM
ncbi:MAG: hypothetical protein LBU34_08425 [Planctomycetaceae bacterium]|nr:hypothetical protein [Planctomycetaceae bacterium]